MKISEIGGEFALIRHLAQRLAHRSDAMAVGIGDDAAVLETAPEPAPYLLATTDLLIENRHFRRHWSTAEQIGRKAAECNLSDIAAMGGKPLWMLVSLALQAECSVAWVEGIYDGLNRSCSRHGVVIAGGDTTQGGLNMISITLLGQVERSRICLRSMAQPGDLVMVTGFLGGSAAALALLEKGEIPDDDLLAKHLTPQSRLDISDKIAPLANAMIDVSDGLGSDLGHICTQSKVSAEIHAGAIPIHPKVLQGAGRLDLDPLVLALGGGEDFELLFTLPPENLVRIAALGIDCRQIGRILNGSEPPCLIDQDGSRKMLISGFDHFT